jgi:hypothetical protein
MTLSLTPSNTGYQTQSDQRTAVLALLLLALERIWSQPLLPTPLSPPSPLPSSPPPPIKIMMAACRWACMPLGCRAAERLSEKRAACRWAGGPLSGGPSGMAYVNTMTELLWAGAQGQVRWAGTIRVRHAPGPIRVGLA